MKRKQNYKIGQDVHIKIGNIPGFVTDIKYEVVWLDKDGAPCRGLYSPVELDLLEKQRPFGYYIGKSIEYIPDTDDE